MVIAGKFKGTIAPIVAVDNVNNMVYVKGVNIVKRAVKGKGFVEKHKPIHRSNVMYYIESKQTPTRIKIVTDPNGKKQRTTVKFETTIWW